MLPSNYLQITDKKINLRFISKSQLKEINYYYKYKLQKYSKYSLMLESLIQLNA